MNRAVVGIIIAFAVVALSGCATVVKGTTQEVRVGVSGPAQADCRASNASGQWPLRAPGTVKVQRSNSALSISCTATGYEEATRVLSSSFNGATLGNLLLGGVIGAAIDAGSGANYSYPESAQLTLNPACAADDAGCLAEIAAAKEREAEAARAAKAERAAAQTALRDPTASAAEKEAALVAEQGRFDAWYPANQERLQHELHSYALRENIYSADCSTGAVNVSEKRVADVSDRGFVVDLRWWKPGKFMGCEVHRHDRFLLRVEDDSLVGVEYLGPAVQSAAAS